MLAGITATKVEATCPAIDRPAGAAARTAPPSRAVRQHRCGHVRELIHQRTPSSGLAEFMATAVRCGG